MILPTNKSAIVREGSILVPTPIRPPGMAYNNSFFSANKEVIYVCIGLHDIFPLSGSVLTTPGLISISSPTFNTPYKILPPAIPPLISSIDPPGLLISKDLITIILGEDLISLLGIGTKSHKYYSTKSILNKNYADMGTIGDFSALVPLIKVLIY